ncbi:MAG: hypothetical protein AAGK92_12345 [Pseudomonadota bacterium]
MKYASLFVLLGLLATTARVAQIDAPVPSTAFAAPPTVLTAPLPEAIQLGAALPRPELVEISLRF